jgi:SlyX protein
MNDALQRLQEKIAYLERHVVEQDKAMLEMAERIDRLKQELAGLRERMPAAPAHEAGGGAPAAERPPHY